MSSKSIKILWAVDPNAGLPQAQKRSVEFLKELEKNRELEVYPAYVLGKDMQHWVGNVTPSSLEPFVPVALTKIREQLDDTDVKNLKEPKVLINYESTRVKDVEALNRYADEIEADFVLTNTHAKEGVERLFVGSFAENLLFTSKRPILYISPNTEKIHSLDTIFCATDFGLGAQYAVDRFLESGLGGREIKFYSAIRPAPAVYTSGASMVEGWIEPSDYLQSEVKASKEELAKAEKLAQSKGFESSSEFNQDIGDIASSIAESAKASSAGLIVLGTEVNKLASFIIGSVARNVIRHSEIPVLVYKYFED